MRNIIIGLAALVAVSAITAPATAQAQNMALSAAQDSNGGGATAPAPSNRARQATDGNRIVCRRFEFSGSRLSRRVCLTQREWAARGELDDR